MKKQSKITIGIAAGILFAVVIIIVTILMTSSNDGKRYAEHMQTAQRYMDELQYEQAIAEYEAAIAIEPNNAGAYQALAELYVRTENYESAAEILNRGIEQTGAEELIARLEEVQAAYENQKVLVEAENEPEHTTGQGQEEQPEERMEAEQVQNENLAEKTGQAESAQLEETQENTGESLERVEREDWGDGQYAIYEYDEKGILVKCTTRYADFRGDLWSGIAQYDEEENCVNVTIYDSDDQIWEYCVSAYDTDENRVKTHVYHADGEFSAEISSYGNNDISEILIQSLYLMMDSSYMTA
ncbi:MAG: tetratricopeptide repeat protein [bacterium]|nr:tetratricopeptide repeat protein [bacterium]